MLGASITSRIRAAARRFIGAKDGNIAVIFAIAAVPVISFVGAAIDYTRANSARSSMQAALNSTALMLAKDLSDGTITKDQVNAKAATYFAALYTNPDAKIDYGRLRPTPPAPARARPSWSTAPARLRPTS